MSATIIEDIPSIHDHVKIGIAIGAGALLGMDNCGVTALATETPNECIDEIGDCIGDLLYALHFKRHHHLFMKNFIQLRNKDYKGMKKLLSNIFILYRNHSKCIERISKHFDDGVSQDKFIELDQDLLLNFLQVSAACLEFIQVVVALPADYAAKCYDYIKNTVSYGTPSYQQLLQPIFELMIHGISHLPVQLPFYDANFGNCLLINMSDVDTTRPIEFHLLVDFLENKPRLSTVLISNVSFEFRAFNAVIDALDLVRKHCQVDLLRVFTDNSHGHRAKYCALYAQLRIMRNVGQFFLFSADKVQCHEWHNYNSGVLAMQMLIQERALRQRMPLLQPDAQPLPPEQLQIVQYQPPI